MSRVDPIDRSVLVEINGKHYRLTLGLRALATFETLRKKTLGAAFAPFLPRAGEHEEAAALRLLEGISAFDLQALLYGLLRKHHPDITEDQVLDLVDVFNVRELGGELLEIVKEYSAKRSGGAGGSPLAVVPSPTG